MQNIAAKGSMASCYNIRLFFLCIALIFTAAAQNIEDEMRSRRYLLTTTQTYETPGMASFLVPAGVTTISAIVNGASGGNSKFSSTTAMGGLGGKIIVDIPVTPGETLQIHVGGEGGVSAGGINGGGAGYVHASYASGGGGGASDIRRSTYALGNRLVVAGGGGGGYGYPNARGGNGGYPSGENGSKGTGGSYYYPPTGGTSSAGGTTSNVNQQYCFAVGSFGIGASFCGNAYGGGGGGGWWGGGMSYGASGGGGSSYIASGVTLVSHGIASDAGSGSVSLTYINLDPTAMPTPLPTSPSSLPTSQPSKQPFAQPSAQPSRQPSSQPSSLPSTQPSQQPTKQPSRQPTTQPSLQPSLQPSGKPSAQPTAQPSTQPSTQPTEQPSGQPSVKPTGQPTTQPSCQPSSQPSRQPSVQPTVQPSTQPSTKPTTLPTRQPSAQPTSRPTAHPSGNPTVQPSEQPTAQPLVQPTTQPSEQPSMQPLAHPTAQPSRQPSSLPSGQPTTQPSGKPSAQPIVPPSAQPSCEPSSIPSAQPSSLPTTYPSSLPSAQPTTKPSTLPSGVPSGSPTAQPSDCPSAQPSLQPSGFPTSTPSVSPSGIPSLQPSAQPTRAPSGQPTAQPSLQPSNQPSASPTSQPSSLPSLQPLTHPSSQPSFTPSGQPTSQPSSQPLNTPTSQPSRAPTSSPTLVRTTREYVYILPTGGTSTIDSTAFITGADWGCGHTVGNGSTCIVVDSPGSLRFQFSWKRVDVTSILQTADHIYFNGVVSTNEANPAYASEIAKCQLSGEILICSAVLFPGYIFSAGAFVSAVNNLVHIGTNTFDSSITTVDINMGVVNSYTISSDAMHSIVLKRILSAPNFIGSFVAGTCETIGSLIYIFAGVVRTDSGAMTATYVTPVSGTIVNNAELVNAMELEYTFPNSFIAGGYPASGDGNYVAYVLCINSIHQRVKFGKHYRARIQVANDRRRLDGSLSVHCIVKSLLILDEFLYILINWNSTMTTNRVSLLKTDLVSGDILHQVHIESSTANLHCNTMHAKEAFITMACLMMNTATGETRSLLLSGDKTMTFSVLPPGFTKSVNETFHAEAAMFRSTKLPIIVRKTTTDTMVGDVADSFTIHPVISKTHAPTMLPSAPRQPSSSPSAAPSVSPQPTSVPSSSGPTNTYKPTAKPTLTSTHSPTATSTMVPSLRPIAKPTVRPTKLPSRDPSPLPSGAPAATPSRAPRCKPTRKPTSTPSFASSTANSTLVASELSVSNYNQNVSQAAFIFLYVLGGLAMAWCLYRVFLCYVGSLQSFELESKKRTHLDYMRHVLANETKEELSAREQRSNIVVSVSKVSANRRVDAGEETIGSNKSSSIHYQYSSSATSSLVLSSLHGSEMSGLSCSVYSDESRYSSLQYSSLQLSRSEGSDIEEGGEFSSN